MPFSHAISHAKAIYSGFIDLWVKSTLASVLRLYGANMLEFPQTVMQK